MATQQQKIDMIQVGNFNMGGLSDSMWSGIKDSFYKLTGYDVHSRPGILRLAQAMKKDSGDYVTEFCKCSVISTNGNTYWGSSTSGKIWQRDSAGVWTLVYTVIPATGEAKILEIREYQDYIYVITEKEIHRIKATEAIGAAQWTINFVTAWATFTLGDKEFHPILEQNLVMYIGDGYYIAQVDAGVFSPTAVDVKPPLRIKTLGGVGTTLLIGTYIDDNVNKTTLYIWDTFSQSFSDGNDIDEVGINAILKADNMILVQAGLAGRLYLYDPTLNTLDIYKTIPGDYSPTQWGRVNPNAVANLNGTMLIGFSNGLGNPADEGVYTIGRNSLGYPFVLNLQYPISERTGGTFALTDIEIGAIQVVGFDIFVSWKHGFAYGVDKLDYSTKVNGAYLETTVKAIARTVLTNFSKYFVAYYSIPTGTNVEIWTSENYKPYTKMTMKLDVDRNILYSEEGCEATTLQLKLKMIAAGNLAPEIESAGISII